MRYYYLIASLPTLTLGRVPAIGEAAFRARCREHLTAADGAAVEDVFATGGAHSDHPFVAAWRERDTRVRNAVARARALRLGRDAAPHLRPEREFDAYTPRAVAEAFARPSPAERELELDRYRWQVIDELAGTAVFTSEIVLAYALKLRLTERWRKLDDAAGRRTVEAYVGSQAAAAPW